MTSKKEQKQKISLLIQRGTKESGTTMEKYEVEVDPGMVVLDAIHLAQAEKSPDLAVRWNCKAGKCGSCAGEVNGKSKLMCMVKISDYPEVKNGKPLEIRPMKSFPLIKDLVTDVSWNFEANKKIKPFTPPQSKEPLIMTQKEVDRIQEFRKCIQCGLCTNTCHVIRTHQLFDEYAGPMNLIKAASLEMHPQDQEDRLKDIKNKGIGIGYCNINKCCTEVCPEHIKITDNALIPLKERVVSRYYDPIAIIFNKLFKRK